LHPGQPEYGFGQARRLVRRACGFLSARAFRFHPAPENVVGNASRFFNLTAGLLEKRLELGGVGQHQPFQFVLIRDRQQHGDRLAVPGDDHRPFLALFQVSA